MPKKQLPGCKRTGHCCSRLPGSMALEAVETMEKMNRKEKEAYNFTKRFIAGWKRGAKKSIKEDKATFVCSFLEGDNACGLQNRKPMICAYSLSEESLLKNKYFKESLFFSHKCGWLDGAPKEMKEIVKAGRGSDHLPLSDTEGRDRGQKKYEDLVEKYKGFEFVYIKDKGWIKRKQPSVDEMIDRLVEATAHMPVKEETISV